MVRYEVGIIYICYVDKLEYMCVCVCVAARAGGPRGAGTRRRGRAQRRARRRGLRGLAGRAGDTGHLHRVQRQVRTHHRQGYARTLSLTTLYSQQYCHIYGLLAQFGSYGKNEMYIVTRMAN